MKNAHFAVLTLAGLMVAGPLLAESAPTELDDLTVVTATPRDAAVKPVVETARRETARPEPAKSENRESRSSPTVNH
ncbi:MAG: hypothetical protein JO300_00345 [Silvibacterium sp.]|nr:hypothetical protein [Silvibacterium sp.]